MDLPEEIKVILTYKCNRDCEFCFNKNVAKKPDLTNSKYIIDRIVESGVKKVRFTGGEPLLHKDLISSLKYAKSKGLYVMLNTNGTINLDQAARFIDDILISFNSTKSRINLKNSADYKIRISTVATPKTIQKLEKYYQVVNNLDIDQWLILRPIPHPKNILPLTIKDVSELIEKIIFLNKKFSRNTIIENAIPFCSYIPEKVEQVAYGGYNEDGHSKLVIDTNGNIKPSYFSDVILGNIKNNSIREAWNHGYMHKLRHYELVPIMCRRCKWIEKCKGGSRFSAKLVNGSLDAPDPLSNYLNIYKRKIAFFNIKRYANISHEITDKENKKFFSDYFKTYIVPNYSIDKLFNYIKQNKIDYLFINDNLDYRLFKYRSDQNIKVNFIVWPYVIKRWLFQFKQIGNHLKLGDLILSFNEYCDKLLANMNLDLYRFPVIIDTTNYKSKKRTDRLLCCTRMEPKKGIHTAIEYALKLQKKLDIISPITNLGDNEQKYYDSLRKHKSIKFLGSLIDKKEKKIDLFARADMLVHLAEGDQETFDRVIIEAHASGLPVIAFDKAPYNQIINKKTGLLIKSINNGFDVPKYNRDNIISNAKKYDYRSHMPLLQNYIEYLHSDNIDIILPVYNNLIATKKTIESICENTKNFRIIIIDDGSDEPQFLSYLKKIQCKNIIVKHMHQNFGFIKSANFGIRYSRSDYFVIANNDIKVENNWLPKMMQGFKLKKRAGIIGPITNDPHNPYQNIINKREGFIGAPYVFGFLMLIKRKVINQCGYFDERFDKGYFEDMDLCFRAHKAGFLVGVCHNTFIHHEGSMTFTKDERTRLFFQNLAKMHEKWKNTKYELYLTQFEKKYLN